MRITGGEEGMQRGYTLGFKVPKQKEAKTRTDGSLQMCSPPAENDLKSKQKTTKWGEKWTFPNYSFYSHN